jgi:ribosomal protein L14E/L6E/L27E
MNIEAERKKLKMSENEFLAIQQPIDRQTGKPNPLFEKVYGSQQKINVQQAEKARQQELETQWEQREREEYCRKYREIHKKYY